MVEMPKTVILDMKDDIRRFEAAVEPVIGPTQVDSAMLLESLWDAIANPLARDEVVDNVVFEWVRGSRIPVLQQDSLLRVEFSEAMSVVGEAMAEQLDYHQLYQNEDRLPYAMEIQSNHLMVLRYDPALIELNQEWKKVAQSLEEDLVDDLEWMD